MNALEQKIDDRTALVCVIGLGYVGLPLAVEFAQAGYRVVGIDLDPQKVASINAGRSYIGDISDEVLASSGAGHQLFATTDFGILAECDTVSICVPTPLRKTKEPDISAIVGACEQIALHLHRDMLIVLESTTYPGTTEEIILPLLTGEAAQQLAGDARVNTDQVSHTSAKQAPVDQPNAALTDDECVNKVLTVGEDFFLAFSPERVDPANPDYTTHNIPKVVGGITPECTRLAAQLYGQVVEQVVKVESTAVAELVKLLENTFRSVNIALANEMAMMCDHLGVDVWGVIDAAATKPFGFMPFYPGPGLGGHCIPIDPVYLTWKARQDGFEPQFIELAGEINRRMPHHVVDKVVDALNQQGKSVKGSTILIVGVAYKKDVSDIRESPALEILTTLRAKGSHLQYHDPFVPSLREGDLELHSVPLSEDIVAAADCIVITTDHSTLDYALIKRCAGSVVDTRNALKSVKSVEFVSAA